MRPRRFEGGGCNPQELDYDLHSSFGYAGDDDDRPSHMESIAPYSHAPSLEGPDADKVHRVRSCCTCSSPAYHSGSVGHP